MKQFSVIILLLLSGAFAFPNGLPGHDIEWQSCSLVHTTHDNPVCPFSYSCVNGEIFQSFVVRPLWYSYKYNSIVWMALCACAPTTLTKDIAQVVESSCDLILPVIIADFHVWKLYSSLTLFSLYVDGGGVDDYDEVQVCTHALIRMSKCPRGKCEARLDHCYICCWMLLEIYTVHD